MGQNIDLDIPQRESEMAHITVGRKLYIYNALVLE